MKKTHPRKKPLTAEAIARMADRGKDVSRFFSNSGKIRRPQKVLRAKTETEAIERALDAIPAEHKRNQLVSKANERFVTSGITIKDVYGKLAK
jgi:hypothetical protein